MLRAARSVKTDFELDLLRRSGVKHERVYRRIPHLYQDGMSDIELQIEIERVSRLEGCLGQFRIAGESMELFMSNILAGDNADAPTPTTSQWVERDSTRHCPWVPTALS